MFILISMETPLSFPVSILSLEITGLRLGRASWVLGWRGPRNLGQKLLSECLRGWEADGAVGLQWLCEVGPTLVHRGTACWAELGGGTG